MPDVLAFRAFARVFRMAFPAEQAQFFNAAFYSGNVVVLGDDEADHCLPQLLAQYPYSTAGLHCFRQILVFGVYAVYVIAVICIQVKILLPQVVVFLSAAAECHRPAVLLLYKTQAFPKRRDLEDSCINLIHTETLA